MSEDSMTERIEEVDIGAPTLGTGEEEPSQPTRSTDAGVDDEAHPVAPLQLRSPHRSPIVQDNSSAQQEGWMEKEDLAVERETPKLPESASSIETREDEKIIIDKNASQAQSLPTPVQHTQDDPSSPAAPFGRASPSTDSPPTEPQANAANKDVTGIIAPMPEDEETVNPPFQGTASATSETTIDRSVSFTNDKEGSEETVHGVAKGTGNKQQDPVASAASSSVSDVLPSKVLTVTNNEDHPPKELQDGLGSVHPVDATRLAPEKDSMQQNIISAAQSAQSMVSDQNSEIHSTGMSDNAAEAIQEGVFPPDSTIAADRQGTAKAESSGEPNEPLMSAANDQGVPQTVRHEPSVNTEEREEARAHDDAGSMAESEASDSENQNNGETGTVGASMESTAAARHQMPTTETFETETAFQVGTEQESGGEGLHPSSNRTKRAESRSSHKISVSAGEPCREKTDERTSEIKTSSVEAASEEAQNTDTAFGRSSGKSSREKPDTALHDRSGDIRVAVCVNPVAPVAKSTKHTVATSGISTVEFLRRSAGGTSMKRRSEDHSAHRKSTNARIEGTRTTATEPDTLRRARADGTFPPAPSNRRRPSQGAPSNELLDGDASAAASLLGSRVLHDGSRRKRPRSPTERDRKRPAKRRTSTPEESRAVGPRESVLPDADAMARISELLPAVHLPVTTAVAAPVAARATPPPPTAGNEKVFLVEQATELVCRALLDGPWPRATDFSVVVAALHQFASDIIVPALYASDPLPTVANDTPIILGTLLMLREALIMNADTIFGIANNDEHVPRRRRHQRDSQGEYFAASTLATSVLLAALDSLGRASSTTFVPRFLKMIDAYESGQGDFAELMLDEEQHPSPAVLCPNGTPMEEEEQDAWRASYRWHTQAHPTVLARHHGPGVRPIRPNAVHISVIGEQSQRRGNTSATGRR